MNANDADIVHAAGPMYDPPHPGGFISRNYLAELGLSARQLASMLGVAPTTVARLVSGQARITPELAVRLEKVLGRTAESWLRMQEAYDLWQARRTVDTSALVRAPAIA
ncbi:MAG: HigA family addiction module antidote protein [Frankiaceae bacterium]|jgi:addiction module HigA family antidote|nr:HigA family addiction module antidote protein [Frankiaceae bacterium]